MTAKKLVFSILATTLILGVVACQKTQGGGGGGDDKTVNVVLTEGLTDTNINGTTISATSTVAGLVKSTKTGNGIPGVAVSDGYQVVKTDANGVYQMKRNAKSRKIYYTTPSQFKINLDSKKHQPEFFTPGILSSTKKYRADFNLTPLAEPEKQFTLIMIGDPQCSEAAEASRYMTETVKDVAKTASSQVNAYAITLGDITFDATNMWSMMSKSMQNIQQTDGRYIPFFQTIGNHDHNSLEAETGDQLKNDYNATGKFFENFGPTDYSFDRGDAHIVVMDDIMVTTRSSSSKPNKYTWGYNGGFSDEQWEWFKQDIASVDNKESKVGFICLHIPFRAGSSSGGSNVNTGRHYNDFLNEMVKFKEFHIMIGHTHYQQNYIHTRNCVGGKPIYEHVHGSACGAWWSFYNNVYGDINVTGGPCGYNVYQIDGANVKNWWMKGANKEKDYQLRVYDGDMNYGNASRSYYWNKASNSYMSHDARGSEKCKNCFVAEVFDDDKSNWTLEFWQNGAKVGNFTRLGDSGFSNVAAAAFFYNQMNKGNSDSYASRTSSHYWYFKAPGGNPATEKNWEVKAIQKIATNQAQVNTYSCKKLTINFDEYCKK